MTGGAHSATGALASRRRWRLRIREALPVGDTLPVRVWHSRHVGVLWLLWAHVAAVPLFALARGFSVQHSLQEAVILPVAAAFATWGGLPRRVRTAVASLGLLMSSAILVHLSGGVIEMHFHFFVMVAVVALYQDWIPFLASVAFVFLHHGVVGVLDAHSVYNHGAAIDDPWTWGAIHSLFIAATSVACLVTWRASERVLDEHRLIEARLLEESQVVKILNEIGMTLSTEVDPRSVMQTATDAATQLTGASFGAFFFTDPDAGDSSPLCTVSGAPDEAFEEFGSTQVTDPLRPWFGGSEVMRLDDVHRDPRFSQNSPLHRMATGHLAVRSYLAVPVRSRSGGVHGGLFFAHPDVGRFDQIAEDLAVGIAAHAALAIDSARLYQREHETALMLQRSLLPQQAPPIPGVQVAFAYSPATLQAAVGGDWYDVFSLPDGRVALTVGDVVGHDMRAAATMGQLRSVLRVAALETAGPAEALAHVDRYMTAAGLAELTTIVHAQLDVDARRLTYASAGHNPPIHLRSSGRAEFLPCEPLPPVGFGLIARVRDPRDHCADLEPGDTLILFTDGLVERRGFSLQDRLDELLEVASGLVGRPPQQFCDGLPAALIGEAGQADDIALLVVSLDGVSQKVHPIGAVACTPHEALHLDPDASLVNLQ